MCSHNNFGLVVMTCYFRHLTGIFAQANITVTAENKKQLDRTIHHVVDVLYKDCPATWREVKKRIAQDQDAFVAALKEAWAQQSL
jgi:hypothetical protein